MLELVGGLLQDGLVFGGGVERGCTIEGADDEMAGFFAVDRGVDELLGFGFLDPGFDQGSVAMESLEDVLGDSRILTGKFNEHVEKKPAPLKGVLADVFVEVPVDQMIEPFQRAVDSSDIFENYVLPNSDRLVVGGVPDGFLALEMSIEPPPWSIEFPGGYR